MEPLGTIQTIRVTPNGGEEILTASQTAVLLQIHIRTVYKLARRGLIPGSKFGGGWRFSKQVILQMVAQYAGKR